MLTECKKRSSRMQGSKSIYKTTFQLPWEQTEFRRRGGSVGRDTVNGGIYYTIEITEQKNVSTTGSMFVDMGRNPLVELLEVGGVCIGALRGKVAIDYGQLETVLKTE